LKNGNFRFYFLYRKWCWLCVEAIDVVSKYAHYMTA
jgi:hypothetical protein